MALSQDILLDDTAFNTASEAMINLKNVRRSSRYSLTVFTEQFCIADLYDAKSLARGGISLRSTEYCIMYSFVIKCKFFNYRLPLNLKYDMIYMIKFGGVPIETVFF